jgi:hypothetical protein
LNGPLAVGVPPTTPPLDKDIPGGIVPPACVHVYGGVPPVAPSVCEYAVPIVPLGSGDVVVIDNGGGAPPVLRAKAEIASLM